MKKTVISIGFTFLIFGSVIAQNAQPLKYYIDKSNMDLSIKPGDNFYEYADGNWIKNNPVPASKTRWGNFDLLREQSSKRMQILLENAEKNRNKNRQSQIIGDFYTSGMDSAAIEAKGYSPIKAQLQQVDEINDLPQLLNEIALLRTTGEASPLFGMYISPDRKNVLKYIPSISFAGTSLPDKDYYSKNDPSSIKIRNAYAVYLKTLFGLCGEDEAQATASKDAVVKIETALAAMQYSRVQMRDPYKSYNKYSLDGLTKLGTVFNWKELFKIMKVNGVDTVLLNNPGLLVTSDSLLKALPLSDWKSYVKWNIIKNAAPYLSSPFVNAEFEFIKVQTGQKEQTPRWERMSNLIDNSLGDFIGELYVEKYFKPEAKVRMLDLVNNLQATFAARIKRLDWMSEATKVKALEKLHAFAKKIAYPDKWKKYEGLTTSKNDFVGNLRNVSTWGYNYMINKMGKPVDRTEMGMTPPTINASYSPTTNGLTFPAGILQYPFFDFGADDAVNYGGIGAVIGHEMTHGFDDQGRQYDAVGNLKDWWVTEDGEKFKAKAQEVVDEYNGFTVNDTIHVNGKLTLGENLADLGGLNIAYEAFTKTNEYKANKKIDGLTPTQRFFLSWAQVWRGNILPDKAAQLILTDPHSPAKWRVNGTVNNLDAWYKAFNIKPGDAMYKKPADRIKIW
ncbi:MAG: M13 family metallopeptidase [Bacteroidetes bacterium]|nr:M13 family metallopeptidase [Bacteroidota bacterium]